MRPQSELLRWYRAHGRDLPWRRTRDPYRILVSEVMLQQTQVDRVLPFYHRWLERFPDTAALAVADLETVHRLWKGLGYPSRAERLRTACQTVIAADGVWPQTPSALQRLPGIGPYTAHAVACFAFAAAVPLVDTNVARVYCRRDGLAVPPPRSDLWRHAAIQVDPRDPIAYNNALMELGALCCTARQPHCDACPWRRRCRACADDDRHRVTANVLRVASATNRYGAAITDRRKPRRHVALALIYDERGRYLVQWRPASKPVGGCWELPGGKREPGESDRQALEREVAEELAGEVLAARPFVTWTHDFGDHYTTFHAYRCRLFNTHCIRPLASDRLQWVTPEELVRLDLPAANQALVERVGDYHRLPGVGGKKG